MIGSSEAPTVEIRSADFDERAITYTPEPAPHRSTIREQSAAEIIGYLKGIKADSEFRKAVEHLYLGRWTREPGWLVAVHSLPENISGGLWHCSFLEAGSGIAAFWRLALVLSYWPLQFKTFLRSAPVIRSPSVAELGTLGEDIWNPSALKTPSYGATMFHFPRVGTMDYIRISC
jgi:hypothetical protein